MQKVFQDSCCQQMHKEISVLNILDCKYNFFFFKSILNTLQNKNALLVFSNVDIRNIFMNLKP